MSSFVNKDSITSPERSGPGSEQSNPFTSFYGTLLHQVTNYYRFSNSIYFHHDYFIILGKYVTRLCKN